MNITKTLKALLENRRAAPFLFVGSGFSARYIGTESWRELLERFCVSGKTFEYYLSSAENSYPKAASLIARDFHEHWWTSDDYAASRLLHASESTSRSSALRIEISNYLSQFVRSSVPRGKLSKEIDYLASCKIDGVITTNWDRLLETMFPTYRTFIGQEELLFANPQGIAEIYKIHGCCSEPETLMLTDEDYESFNEKNSYLAAKLTTIFVEHPILFLGTSITDPDIIQLLRRIAECIGKKHIEELRRNLIFVEAAKGSPPEIGPGYVESGTSLIPLTVVKTDSFMQVYKAIDNGPRLIPARVLRVCKEQFYALVHSAKPEKSLFVNIEDLELTDKVEFAVGIGVAAENGKRLEKLGYKGLKADDLFHDLLWSDKNLDAKEIVDQVLSEICVANPNAPFFKYLTGVGIQSYEDYKDSKLPLDNVLNKKLKANYRSPSCADSFQKRYSTFSFDDLVQNCPPQHAALFIPYLEPEKIDLDKLLMFLREHEERLYKPFNYRTNFKKLAALFDKMKWGWLRPAQDA